MQTWPFVLLVAAVSFCQAQTVMFDLDTGAPMLSTAQPAPFDQTSGGVTAHFGGAFSLQTDSTTNLKLSQFSGKYLYPSNQNPNILNIRFSQPVTGVTLVFATADFHQTEVPTTLQLSALLDTNAIGTTTAHGTYGSDSMPMGTLSFNSGGKPFNTVEVSVPFQPQGASAFLVDNVSATLAAAVAFANVSAASYGGGPLAAGQIATAFGQGLAAAREGAVSQPLPTTLASTTVTVTDSAGVARQAPLFYVDPAQVNYIVPDGAAAGAATVTITSGGQTTATGTISVGAVAPGLFTANFDGKGAPSGLAVSVAPDLTQSTQPLAVCGSAPGSCTTSPIDLGPAGTQVILELYGTGIRGRSSLAGVTARIGSFAAAVQYAGAQSQFAGLDQVNVAVPPALAGQREVELVLTVDGKPANTVRVNFK